MLRDEFKPRIRWRWGIVVAIAMTVPALFPQIYLRLNRGAEFQGANAISHPDEVAYSAYVASLIRGNPRCYDPYTGRGAARGATAPESLFSIQFVPAYVAALPARWLGVSASTVFMLAPALCALASALALFWFIALLTRAERFSAAAVAVILGFGTVMAGQGIARHVPNLNFLIPLWISNWFAPTSIYHLPFLRFYQPAVAFPLFFIFCALMFLALTSPNVRRAAVAAAGAGLIFALLIFSYFYLWTAAAVWVVCVCALWLIARRSDRKQTLIAFSIIALFAVAALTPYLSMLSHRAATVDAAQALLLTHRPDLFRLPEIAALLVIAILGLGAWRGVIRWREPLSLITLSLALTVFGVFNQQVITGRSLQPIHYEWFIANYCALVALVLTLAQWGRDNTRWLSGKRLILISIVALLWATGEVWLAASVGWDYNRRVDEARPVVSRLAALNPSSGSVVLTADLKLADRLPTDAPQALLWAPRMLVFPGVTETENRERFYRQLYYLGYDEKKFWAEFDQPDWNFLAGLFAYDRLSPVVSGSSQPITPAELSAQLANYLEYARTFNRDRAATPALSFLIVPADKQPDYANLDRWYQRDNGERIGNLILYRVTLRT